MQLDAPFIPDFFDKQWVQNLLERCYNVNKFCSHYTSITPKILNIIWNQCRKNEIHNKRKMVLCAKLSTLCFENINILHYILQHVHTIQWWHPQNFNFSNFTDDFTFTFTTDYTNNLSFNQLTMPNLTNKKKYISVLKDYTIFLCSGCMMNFFQHQFCILPCKKLCIMFQDEISVENTHQTLFFNWLLTWSQMNIHSNSQNHLVFVKYLLIYGLSLHQASKFIQIFRDNILDVFNNLNKIKICCRGNTNELSANQLHIHWFKHSICAHRGHIHYVKE